MLARVLVAAGLLVSSALVWGQSSTLTADLDERIASALNVSGAPSVSVAVVKDGQIAYAKAFGKANIGENRPATAATRYAIGSVSKQFTAAGMLLLAEQGKL